MLFSKTQEPYNPTPPEFFKTLKFMHIVKKYKNYRNTSNILDKVLLLTLSERIIYFALVGEQLASSYCDRFSISNLWEQGIPMSARGHMVLLVGHMENQLGRLKIYGQLSMLKGHKLIKQWLTLSCYVREIPPIVKFFCQQEKLLTQITKVCISNGPFSGS